jgi:hypothetical protein
MPATCTARASIALSVGAAKVTKMRGEFDLAKIRPSALVNPATQAIEYKGFGGQKARILLRAAIQEGGEKRKPAGATPVTPYN